jgi:hypothetical protein
MKGGMGILKPLLAETGAPRVGKMVIGTVKGDIHDIGQISLQVHLLRNFLKILMKVVLQGGLLQHLDLVSLLVVMV